MWFVQFTLKHYLCNNANEFCCCLLHITKIGLRFYGRGKAKTEGERESKSPFYILKFHALGLAQLTEFQDQHSQFSLTETL